jgi:hypothetical protein
MTTLIWDSTPDFNLADSALELRTISLGGAPRKGSIHSVEERESRRLASDLVRTGS